MASKKPSKPAVQFHFTCRRTALTSIRSSNYSPSSKPCCGRSPRIPSRPPHSPSTACARPLPLVSARSPGRNVPHTLPTQDMVNLIGKCSNEPVELHQEQPFVVGDIQPRRSQVI